MSSFKWPSIYRMACPKPSFLHRFWSKKCASHFCRETRNKNIQFSKWETWMFNAILDQTNLWRVYFISFLNLLVWVSAMQCIIEWRKGNASRWYIKRTPPPWLPPSGGARVGRGAGELGPSSYAPACFERTHWVSLTDVF